MQPYRRSGRTTRMLKEAMKLAQEGRAVYIVAHTSSQVKELENRLGPAGEQLGIKVDVPEFLGNLSWETLTLTGAHPNCVVLVDHHTIEARFAGMLEMLHRFDEDKETS